MTTTYDFGAGLVPAHQHINRDGSIGGWVADTAAVSPAVYVGPYARVAGGTIHGGAIHGGAIDGGTIHGGAIHGGAIDGGTIYGGTIHGGIIRGGIIFGGTIHGGTIYGGSIYGGSIHGGAIHGGIIRGGIIFGGAIRGGTIYGGTIDGGVVLPGWTIRRSSDRIALGPFGSRDDLLTAYRHEGGRISLATGCWTGSPDDLRDRIDGDPERTDYLVALEMVAVWARAGAQC